MTPGLSSRPRVPGPSSEPGCARGSRSRNLLGSTVRTTTPPTPHPEAVGPHNAVPRPARGRLGGLHPSGRETGKHSEASRLFLFFSLSQRKVLIHAPPTVVTVCDLFCLWPTPPLAPPVSVRLPCNQPGCCLYRIKLFSDDAVSVPSPQLPTALPSSGLKGTARGPHALPGWPSRRRWPETSLGPRTARAGGHLQQEGRQCGDRRVPHGLGSGGRSSPGAGCAPRSLPVVKAQAPGRCPCGSRGPCDLCIPRSQPGGCRAFGVQRIQHKNYFL